MSILFRVAVFILCTSLAPVHAWNVKDLDVDKTISAGKKVTQAAVGISEEEEIAIGADVARRMSAKTGTVKNTELVAYITEIGQAVAAKSTRPNLTYHFQVLATPDINAFAAPGGYIFVTQGLLDFLQDEAELAGVLGHEVGHVTQKHVVKAIQKSNLLSAGVDLAGAQGQNAQLQEALAKFSVDLLEKGLSRQDELEADQVGTVFMSKAGYTPIAMKETLARLGQMQGKSSVTDKLYKTHPPTDARVKEVDSSIAKNKLATDGQRQKHRFQTRARKA